MPGVQWSTEVLVRIYINLRAREKSTGPIVLSMPRTTASVDFITGFNKKLPTFEILDTGNGKECAGSKIKKTFEMFLHNDYRKHILLGGPPDRGYARLLGQYCGDEAV